MAKKVLLDVLSSTVGKYVENLDAKSLNVAVWSGSISLSGLKLDVEAVNDELSRRAKSAPNLALPIRVVEGHFETLKVEVPWARITSRPVVIKAAGFNVVVEPYDHLQGIVDVAAKKRRETRKDEITTAEEDRKRRNAILQLTPVDLDGGDGAMKDPNNKGTEGGGGFASNLVRRIIENLQIEIKSFDVSLRGCGTAAGIVLGGLSLTTTDESGTEKFVDRTLDDSKFLHKSLTMAGFGVYCDSGVTSAQLQGVGHSYILSPMAFKAEIRQSDHEEHMRYPKYLVKSYIPTLGATLSRRQLELTNKISSVLTQNQDVASPLFPEYRPTSDIIGGDVRKWWKYAVRCIGRLNRRRSWTEMILASRKRMRYIPLYMRAANHDDHKWLSALSEIECEQMEIIEQDMSISVEGLMLWRNIADAQVKKEIKRREEALINAIFIGEGTDSALESDSPIRSGCHSRRGRPSLQQGSSIFTSARMELSDPLDQSSHSSAPITLSADELKNIEDVMFDRGKSDVSGDSKLYDLSFELGCFSVNLAMNGHLGSLDMGRATTTFKANADGSFDFGFAMADLRVDNKGTKDTLFHSILRSLHDHTLASTDLSLSSESDDSEAFVFHLTKSKTGDQELKMKMVSFEVVASQGFITGMKEFFTFVPSDEMAGGVSTRTNEMASDAVETIDGINFYESHEEDAGRHPETNIVDMTAGAAASAAAAVSGALATSIVDAWNSKREMKKAWTIELDLHAPIIVLPLSEVDPQATTLIADLGRFVVVFGTNAQPLPKMQDWFDTRAPSDDEKFGIDYCNFTLEDFSLLVGRAHDKDRLIVNSSRPNDQSTSNNALIEPMSLNLCIGLESVAEKGDGARTCLIGVLPFISIQASLGQIRDILALINTWTTFLRRLGRDNEEVEDTLGAIEYPEQADQQATDLSRVSMQGLKSIEDSRLDGREKTYFSIDLKRLSAKLLTHRGDSIEAHLISTKASASIFDNDTTQSRLAMGYFWLFDSLHNEFPRVQRLLAHSTLPRSASSFAEGGAYNILDELAKDGVFDEDRADASYLAEITISTSLHSQATNVDGIFSSMYINLNPLAVRQIISDISLPQDNCAQDEDYAMLDQKQEYQEVMPHPAARDTIYSKETDIEGTDIGTSDKQGSLQITATWKGFEILTRSPNDDHPLLRFAMTETKASYKSSLDGSNADVKLSNLIVEDQREIALMPNFNNIISQRTGDTEEENCFRIFYSKTASASTQVNVGLGCPCIALPSDALIDIVSFYCALFPAQDEKETVVDKAEANGNDRALVGSESGVELGEAPRDSEIAVTICSGDNCRIILVDVGNTSNGGLDNVANICKPSTQSRLADAIVFQGKVSATVRMYAALKVSSNYELNWDHVEVFTAHGRQLSSPIQIVEPCNISAMYRTEVENQSKESELKFWTLDEINFTISMQDIALLLSILGSFRDAFEEESDPDDKGSDNPSHFDGNCDKIHATKELSEEERRKIKMLFIEMQGTLGNEMGYESTEVALHDVANVSHNPSINDASSATDRNSRLIRVNVSFPQTSLTFINDLQGTDDGLLNLFVRDFLIDGEIQYPSSGEAHSSSSTTLPAGSNIIKPVFKFELSNIVSADYFDTHVGLWEPLLLKPWESSFSALRAPSQHPGSNRLHTTIDIESNPCHIAFSENFLVSLGAANQMWSSYSFATTKAAAIDAKVINSSSSKDSDDEMQVRRKRKHRANSLLVRKSTAANAARNFVTSSPYMVTNRSGMTAYFSISRNNERYRCDDQSKEYFRFDPPKSKGLGGKRSYGQYVTQFKSLTLTVGEKIIKFPHLDAYLTLPREVHDLGFGHHIFTEVIRMGSTICLILSSHVSIFNLTSSLDFNISFDRNGEQFDVGIAKSSRGSTPKSKWTHSHRVTHALRDGLGIPVKLLGEFEGGILSNEVESDTRGVSSEAKSSSFAVKISTILLDKSSNSQLTGYFVIPPAVALSEKGEQDISEKSTDVICTSNNDEKGMIIRVVYQVCSIGGHPCLSIFLQPRAALQNKSPVKLQLRAPPKFIFSSSNNSSLRDTKTEDGDHTLEPFEEAEIFTSSESLSISFKIAKQPIEGSQSGWSESGSISLPLNQKIATPFKATLPFISRHQPAENLSGGEELFLLEASDLAAFAAIDEDNKHSHKEGGGRIFNSNTETPDSNYTHDRTICVVAMNFAIDHTGEILLAETVENSSTRRSSIGPYQKNIRQPLEATSVPFGAFSLPNRKARLILIPSPDTPMKLIHSKGGPALGKKSSSFCVNDIIFCGGGVQSSSIPWDNKSPSGFFAYRKFTAFGQSEIHIIPEFVFLNGSGSDLWIKQDHFPEAKLRNNDVAPLAMPNRGGSGLYVSLLFPSFGAFSDKVRIDGLGIMVTVVKRTSDEKPIGSIAIQTEPGESDSRLVIKAGELKLSAIEDVAREEENGGQIFYGDFLRFRSRIAELDITLNDTQQLSLMNNSYDKNRPSIETAFHIEHHSNQKAETAAIALRESGVAQIIFKQVKVDFQRIFRKDIDESLVTEKSQLAVMVRVFQIKDCTPDSRLPLVFDSSGADSNFVDFCIRRRGPLNTDLVRLDCIDLNLACSGETPDTIAIRTDERFLWKSLDVLNRISLATSELAGVDMHLEHDEESGEYTVSREDATSSREGNVVGGSDYKTYEKSSETLYNVALVRVSPIKLIVSFLREPDASRYQQLSGQISARAVNYFTRRMTFEVDRARLSFAGYANHNVKGSSGQIISTILTVYIARLKRKTFSLLTAVSLKDWNYLTARDDDEKGYVEGDLLRLTGNVAGRSAGYVLERVGEGIDENVRAVTGTLGNGIQQATEFIGVGVVGTGINVAVTGVGTGVGSTVKGAGQGTGKIVRGAARGVGQAAGGVGGGAAKVAKGLGKGVISGDAGVALAGLSEGATSAAQGVSQGVETIVMGTSDGVQTAGRGLRDGLQSLMGGICYCCIGDCSGGSVENSEHGSTV